MKRRTLDYIFSSGGALLAIVLIVLGFVLASQASFAKDYVKEQLGEQKITFATADKLTDADKTWKPGSTCLVKYAGQLMEKGKQAECYANYYIAMHMRNSAKTAGYPDDTYATMGNVQTQLRADLAAAKDKGDTAGAADIQKKLDAATSLRSTFQTGETLRGLLLTSYGFSIFGEKAALAGNLCLAAGGLMVLLSLAGFVHALRTPEDKLVGAAAARPAGAARTA